MESWGFAPAALMLLGLSCYGFGRVLLSLARAAHTIGRPASVAFDSQIRSIAKTLGAGTAVAENLPRPGCTSASHTKCASARTNKAIASAIDDWFTSSQRADWAMALGATVAAAVIVLLGFIGMLTATALWCMTLTGGLGAVAYLLVFDRLSESPRRVDAPTGLRLKLTTPGPTLPPLFRSVVAAGLIAAAAMLLISQAPPTSDDVVPSLESAQRWLLQSRVVLTSDSSSAAHNDAVALLPRAWFVWALALGGPEAARGLGVLWALALAAAAWRCTAAALGRRSALMAACLALLAPGVIGGALSLDPALPAVALTLLAFDGLGRLGAGRSSRSGPAAVLCGIVLGGSLNAAALPTLLMAALWAAARSIDASNSPAFHAASPDFSASNRRSTPAGRAWQASALIAAIAAAAAVHLAVLAAGGAIDFTLAQSTAPAATGNAAAPWGGPSIAVVVLLPMALGLAQPAALSPMRIALPAYLLLTAPIIARAEACLPLIVVLTLPALHALKRIEQMSAMPRRIVAAATTAGMLATAAAALWHWAPAATAALGGDRDDYLLRHQPHWSIAAAADRMLPADAHLLTPTDSGFYFRRRNTSYLSLLRRADEQGVLWNRQQLAAQLRSAGLTHVLAVRFIEPQFDDLPPAIARLNELVVQAAEGSNPWPCAIDLASPDRRIRYQIWKIPD